MTTVERFEKNIDQVNSDFQAIKSKLIECGVEVADGTRTAELADKVGEVYEAGRKAENDAFWDAYQQNGTRTNYDKAFGGIGWDDASFKPKYNIKISSNDMMFGSTAIKDLGAALRKAGVTMTLALNSYGRMYQGALLERIGGIIYEYPLRAFSYTFYDNKKLVAIEDVIPLTENGNCTFSATFTNCYELVDVRFSGVIGQNGLDLHWSTKLSYHSIYNIIEHLSDNPTVTSPTITLSLTAVNEAFKKINDFDKGDYIIGSETGEWEELVASKPNWNIVLA